MYHHESEEIYKLLNYDAILFDVDGTLIDSAPGIINTLKEVMDYGFYVLKQVCLNILLFVPFGLLVGLIKQSGRNILIASLIISVTIEALQYYNGRFADIDDVIWNVSGALIGYLIYLSYQKIKHLLMIPKAATN